MRHPTTSARIALASVLFTAAALQAAPAMAADKKPAKAALKAEQVQAPPAVDPQVQIAYLANLATQLKTCRSAYVMDNQAFRDQMQHDMTIAEGDSLMAGTGGRVSAVKIEKMRQQALADVMQQSKYKGCKDDAVAGLSGTTKGFVTGFKDVAVQAKAKEALAQWMTALDATSTDGFDGEFSKFNTLSNTVKLEITLN